MNLHLHRQRRYDSFLCHAVGTFKVLFLNVLITKIIPPCKLIADQCIIPSADDYKST